MPDSDHSLEILIKTKADLAAAVAAQQAIEKQIFNAKLLGKEYSQQEAQLGQVRSHIQAYTDKTGESAESVEKLELNHHALHHIMHMIGDETAPQLGTALTGALYGPIGAVIAIGALFQLLAKHLEEVHEKAVALVNVRWETSVSSLNDYTKSANDLTDAMEKASKAADPIKEKYSAATAVLDAHIAAHKKILDAMEKEELAAAGDDKDKQAQIKARYGDYKSKSELADEQSKLDLQQKEIDDRIADKPKLEAKAKAASQAVVDAKNNREAEKAAAELETTDKKAIESDRELIERKGGADGVRKMKAPEFFIPDSGGDHMIVNPERKAYEKAQTALARVEAFDKNNTAVNENTEVVRRLTKKAEDADKADVDNQQAITEQIQKLETDKKVHEINAGATKDVKEIGAPQTPSGKSLLGAQQDAANILTGHMDRVNEEHQNALTKLGELIAGHAVTLQQAAQMITWADANQKHFMTTLDRMEQHAETMRNFSTTSAAALDKINKEIIVLTQRIQNTLNK